MFDNALKSLDDYWNGREWVNGFKVTSTGVTSTLEFDTIYDDYDLVKDALDSSLRAVNEDPAKLAIVKEWRTYVKHMDRRPGLVIFRKGFCGSRSCSCKDTIKEPNLVPGSRESLFPSITKDPNLNGPFMTYHQLVDTERHDEIGQHFTLNNHGRCHKCRYIFSSESDKDRHILLVHKGKKPTINREMMQMMPLLRRSLSPLLNLVGDVRYAMICFALNTS